MASAREPPSPYFSLSATNLAEAPAIQASAAATNRLFPGGLRAARMQSPERPSPSEPLDRNPGARLKVRGRRRAMPQRRGPRPPRQHPVEGRAVLPGKHSPSFLGGLGFFFFLFCGSPPCLFLSYCEMRTCDG